MASLSKTAIEWAIDHHSNQRDTDIFPRAFEYDAISHCRDDVITALSKQDICQWSTRPFNRCLVPKHRHGFRIATQLDPLDMLFFTSLCIEIGEEIEKARLSTNRNIAFSYRFLPDSTQFLMFGKNMGYQEFQEHNRQLAQESDFVVITDIADFYPRIYLHRLENALHSALRAYPTYAKAIIQLIKGWNLNISYGIPVGNNPSRLLAELVISDVDRGLVAEDFVFTRYVDDYRIFCSSRQEAYQRLARLAHILFHDQGLNLQSSKTRILSSEEYLKEISKTEDQEELDTLNADFDNIVAALGFDNRYQTINYDELEPELQAQIDALNLEGLLDRQLEQEEIDISMMRFLINRFAQLKQTSVLRKLLTGLDKLFPVFPEIVTYLIQLKNDILPESRVRVGNYLLNNLNGSVLSHLEFHHMLTFSLFADSNNWGDGDRLISIYNTLPDNLSRHMPLLAIGRAGKDYWVRQRKSEVDQMIGWPKRAFLYASSCLPKDERDNYYKALKSRLDYLDEYIIEWAKKTPIYS
jgi:hypothetical protein